MPAYADQLMVKFLDADAVQRLLLPPGDATQRRARRMIAAVYELTDVDIESVDGVEVLRREFQAPLLVPAEVRGTWERTGAAPERWMAAATLPPRPTAWLGMELEVRFDVRVSVTAGALESLVAEDLSDVTSLADFASRFHILDLDAFVERAGVNTVEELRAKLPQRVELGYAEPPPFNPAHPGAVRGYRAGISAVFAEGSDLSDALQEVKALRSATELGGEVAQRPPDARRAARAWLVVFPAAATLPAGVTAAQVEDVFAAEGIVAAFESAA